jgi:hypothetical protein
MEYHPDTEGITARTQTVLSVLSLIRERLRNNPDGEGKNTCLYQRREGAGTDPFSCTPELQSGQFVRRAEDMLLRVSPPLDSAAEGDLGTGRDNIS